MPKPSVVMVAACLHCLGAVLWVLAGAALAYLSFPGAPLGGKLIWERIGWAEALVGAVFFLSGLMPAGLWLATAIGLWRLRNWARRLSLLLSFLTLMALSALLVVSLPSFTASWMGVYAVGLPLGAAHGWLIWSLLRPKVKRAFGK